MTKKFAKGECRQIVNEWIAKDVAAHTAMEVQSAFRKFMADNLSKDKKFEFRKAGFEHYFALYSEEAAEVKETVIIKTSEGDLKIPTNLTKVASKTHEAIKIVLKTFSTGIEKLPEGIFIPFKTRKGIDRLFSSVPQEDGTKENGPMKGTVTLVTGTAGTGKSTLVYDMQACLQDNYPNEEIVCLQAEMSKLDLEFEQLSKPWMKKVKFLVIQELCTVINEETGEEEIMMDMVKDVILAIFNHGYDILFIDSFQVLVDLLVAYADMNPGQAETWLVNETLKTISAKNQRKIHTAIISIQQETKGGMYKGSSKLKHAITGMLHLRLDSRGERYATFSKNRRNGGDINKRMFFGLDKNSDMVYNVEDFEANEETIAKVKREQEKIREHGAGAKFFERFKKEKLFTESGELIKESQRSQNELDEDVDDDDDLEELEQYEMPIGQNEEEEVYS